MADSLYVCVWINYAGKTSRDVSSWLRNLNETFDWLSEV